MKNIEINLKVVLHKVKLQVKFPSSLVAILKVQNLQASFGSEIPFKFGQAIPEATANLTFTALSDNSKNVFSQKKISVCIFLSTSSGRIPAGAAYIGLNMLKKGPNRESINIEKCPDKTALIEATISYQILSQSTFFSAKEMSSIRSNKQTSPSELFTLRQNSLAQQANSLSQQVKAPRKSKQKFTEGIANSPKQGQESESVKASVMILQRSKVQSEHSNGMIESNIMNTKNEKTDREYFSPKNSSTVDYTAKIRVAQLQKQLKNIQKKYEQCSVEFKSTLAKKDMFERQLKESQGQLQLYKEKYQDLQQSTDNTQKRTEYKENSYKQQIKHLAEKLAASQNEKQSMIFQKNDLVSEFEERQKTLRIGVKQKEKQFSDEKSKLNKKIEQMGKDLAQLQIKISQADLKLVQANRQSQNLLRKNEFLDQTCRQYQKQLQSLKQSLSLQKNKRQQLQEAKGDKVVLEEEKKRLKKKMVEQEQQITKKLSTHLQLQSNYQRLFKKLEQTETTLKNKVVLLKNLQKDFDNLSQQHQALKKELQSKSLQLQETLMIKQSQKNRADIINDQLRQLQKKTGEEIKLLKKDQQQKQNKIKALLRQNQDLAESINDYNSRVQHLQVQLEVLSSKINVLTVSNEELEHKNAELDGEIISLETHLSEEKESKERLQLNLRGQNNHREIKIQQLQDAIKQLQIRLANTQQEDAFRMSSLTQKNELLQDQLKKNAQQLQALKNNTSELEQAKYKGQTFIQQLQYSIKLKVNQITFLKQSVQRNTQEANSNITKNREMQQAILKTNGQNEQFKMKMEVLSNALNEAKKEILAAQQALNSYVNGSNGKLRQYLSALCKEQQINFIAYHQQSQIQTLMRASINKINQVYAKLKQQIKQLKQTLSLQKQQTIETNTKLKQSLEQNSELQHQLQDLSIKVLQTNKCSDILIGELKTKISHLNKQAEDLQHQNAGLKQFNSNLSLELKALKEGLGSRSSQNSSLKAKVERLQETIKMQQQQFSLNQSRQSTKFQEQSTTLKSFISQLQQKSDKQANKIADLTSQLNQINKNYKQLQRTNLQQSKKLTSEIEKLNNQVGKQAKQLEAKANLNSRYNQIEAQLRNKVDQANKDILALKELNENIRKRNQKATQKQKEQETIIAGLRSGQSQLNTKQSDLEKAIRQRTAEFVASRQYSYQLQKEKQKLVQQLQITNSLVKVKQDAQNKSQISIKNLQQQRNALKDKIKLLQIGSAEASKKKEKETALLEQAKSKLTAQLQEARIKLQARQKQYKIGQQGSKKLAQQMKQLISRNKELQIKITTANQNLIEQQKLVSVEEKYLKPVRDNLQLIKAHFSQYSKTADQFQANKNKLIKLTTTKTQLPNEKYINDRIKQFSLAYNKLKIFILGCNLTAQAKNQAGQEIKKVQVALDRVLRGEK